MTSADDASDLRRIGLAVIERARIESEIESAVVAARGNGRSWGAIAMVLGTSKQAALERFGVLANK